MTPLDDWKASGAPGSALTFQVRALGRCARLAAAAEAAAFAHVAAAAVSVLRHHCSAILVFKAAVSATFTTAPATNASSSPSAAAAPHCVAGLKLPAVVSPGVVFAVR